MYDNHADSLEAIDELFANDNNLKSVRFLWSLVCSLSLWPPVDSLARRCCASVCCVLSVCCVYCSQCVPFVVVPGHLPAVIPRPASLPLNHAVCRPCRRAQNAILQSNVTSLAAQLVALTYAHPLTILFVGSAQSCRACGSLRIPSSVCDSVCAAIGFRCSAGCSRHWKRSFMHSLTPGWFGVHDPRLQCAAQDAAGLDSARVPHHQDHARCLLALRSQRQRWDRPSAPSSFVRPSPACSPLSLRNSFHVFVCRQQAGCHRRCDQLHRDGCHLRGRGSYSVTCPIPLSASRNFMFGAEENLVVWCDLESLVCPCASPFMCSLTQSVIVCCLCLCSTSCTSGASARR